MWRRTCLQRYTWNFADGSCQLWRRETLLESMLADFPTLRLEDIQAAISFAATAAAEDVPHRPQPDVSHRSRSGLSSRRIFPSRWLLLCQGSWQVFRGEDACNWGECFVVASEEKAEGRSLCATDLGRLLDGYCWETFNTSLP